MNGTNLCGCAREHFVINAARTPTLTAEGVRGNTLDEFRYAPLLDLGP